MTEVWGWEAFFDHVLSFLRQIRLENTSQDILEFYLEHLERIIPSTERIKNILHSSQSNDADQTALLLHYRRLMDELIMHLNQVYAEVNISLDNYLSHSSTTAYRSGVIHSGRRGRPKFNVTANQLEYLTSLSFTWTQIARMLGISRMTLFRRRVEFGMLHQGQTIQDDELLRLLREMRSEFPEMGEVMVSGRLRALGYSIVRDRVRRAIRETDPLNTALRAIIGPLARRVYSVPGPNSLWHVGKFGLASGVEPSNLYTIHFFSQTATTSWCGGGSCLMEALMAIAA